MATKTTDTKNVQTMAIKKGVPSLIVQSVEVDGLVVYKVTLWTGEEARMISSKALARAVLDEGAKKGILTTEQVVEMVAAVEATSINEIVAITACVNCGDGHGILSIGRIGSNKMFETEIKREHWNPDSLRSILASYGRKGHGIVTDQMKDELDREIVRIFTNPVAKYPNTANPNQWYTDSVNHVFC